MATRAIITMLSSSNSGVWSGSTNPAGLFMRAMLTCSVAELTRPTNVLALRHGPLLAVAWSGEFPSKPL